MSVSIYPVSPGAEYNPYGNRGLNARLGPGEEPFTYEWDTSGIKLKRILKAKSNAANSQSLAWGTPPTSGNLIIIVAFHGNAPVDPDSSQRGVYGGGALDAAGSESEEPWYLVRRDISAGFTSVEYPGWVNWDIGIGVSKGGVAAWAKIANTNESGTMTFTLPSGLTTDLILMALELEGFSPDILRYDDLHSSFAIGNDNLIYGVAYDLPHETYSFQLGLAANAGGIAQGQVNNSFRLFDKDTTSGANPVTGGVYGRVVKLDQAYSETPDSEPGFEIPLSSTQRWVAGVLMFPVRGRRVTIDALDSRSPRLKAQTLRIDTLGANESSIESVKVPGLVVESSRNYAPIDYADKPEPLAVIGTSWHTKLSYMWVDFLGRIFHRNHYEIDPYSEWFDAPGQAIGQSWPRRGAVGGNGALLTSGVALFVPVFLRAGHTATGIGFKSATTAMATPAHWWFALYSGFAWNTPSLMAQSADQLTAAWGANTAKELTLQTEQYIYRSGWHWAAVMVSATTVPTIRTAVAGNVQLSSALGGIAPITTGTGGSALGATAPSSVSLTEIGTLAYAWVNGYVA